MATAAATSASGTKGALRGNDHEVPKLVLVGVLLTVAIVAFGLLGQGMWLGSIQSAIWTFSDVDDVVVQQAELSEYLAETGRLSRLEQVDLAAHAKVSQFADIDATRRGFGRNACGLVAAAAALGGDDWTPLVGIIARAAGDAYHPNAGIQPAPYAEALQAVFGDDRVVALDRGSLGQLHQQLEAGRVVIVDIKINEHTRQPSAEPPTYAHFARVLGMDAGAGEIYLENTLTGGAIWTVPFEEFMAAWQWPETSSSTIPDPLAAEAVTRWAVAIVPVSGSSVE